MCKVCDTIDAYTHSIILKQRPEIALLEKFEKSLATKMLLAYTKSARRAIKEASAIIKRGSGNIKESEIKKIIANTNEIMDEPFTEDQMRSFDKDISRFYIAQRKLDMKLFKLKIPTELEDEIPQREILKQEDESIRLAFDLKDQAIVEQIRAQNRIAGRKLYKSGYSKHFSDAMEKTVGEVGLSRTAAGPAFQRNMASALGLTESQLAAEIIPAAFDGTALDYYTGLSGTSMNRAQGFNRMNLFGQAGVERYQIVAIIDNRTSEICEEMNGRIFTMSQGEGHMANVLEATSPTALKKVAGWRRDLSEFGVKTKGAFKTGPRAAGFSQTLADNGMALPPYHFRCRTTVRPLGL